MSLAPANGEEVPRPWLAELRGLEASEATMLAVEVAIIVVLGLVLGRVLAGFAARIAARRGSPQQVMIARRAVFYGVLTVAVLMLLDTLGVQLGVLLGAAGILTVALGFAAQTSTSNLISGLFLLGERPFVVGDMIRVGEHEGVVLSVDLLSVKLRTFDSLLLRVPNETLIKSEIINSSRFPIRRMQVDLRLRYDEDLERVQALLLEIAHANPDLLEEPAPVVWVDRLGESAIHLRLMAWAANERGWFDLRSRLHRSVAARLHEAKVAVAYPRLEFGDEQGPQLR